MGSRKGVPNKTDKYETVILTRLSDIQEWIINGENVRDICEKLDISPDTWYRYCKEHEALSELVLMGRSLVNAEVENSLFKLCMGYEYEVIKTVIEEDKNGKKRTRIEKTKHHQPPSAQAISFWLRNRAPEQWNDRKELVLETKQNEEARKKLFLEMIDEEIVDAEYEIVNENMYDEDME